MACAGRGAGELLGLMFPSLSQAVESLELVFGERFGICGVESGGGGIDCVKHHVQGRKPHNAVVVEAFSSPRIRIDYG